MASMRRWDAIVLPVYEGEDEDTWLAAFRGVGLSPWMHRLDRLLITLEHVRPFDAILAEQGKKYRQNVRRARKAAARLGVTCTLYESRADVDRHLDTIARIAEASWKHTGRGGTQIAMAYEGRQRRFFEALLRMNNDEFIPIVGIASWNGDPIAVLFSLRHAATVTTMLTFWDGRCRDTSPGQMLIWKLIDWAADRKLNRVDFNATQLWVRHFTDERRTLANIVAFAPTLAGSALALASRAARLRHAQRTRD